jgi:hypothetical protein
MNMNNNIHIYIYPSPKLHDFILYYKPAIHMVQKINILI